MWKLSLQIQEKSFVSEITKMSWILMIEKTLSRAFDIDNDLMSKKQTNVVIHCPTGDDGSCVLSSLA